MEPKRQGLKEMKFCDFNNNNDKNSTILIDGKDTNNVISNDKKVRLKKKENGNMEKKKKENPIFNEDHLYSCKKCLDPFCFETDISNAKNYEVPVREDLKLKYIYIFSSTKRIDHENFYNNKFKFESIRKSNDLLIKCKNCLQKVGTVKYQEKAYFGRLDFENLILTKIPKQIFKTKVDKVEFEYEEVIEKRELFKDTLLEINKFREILSASKDRDFPEVFEKIKLKTIEVTELTNKIDKLEIDL